MPQASTHRSQRSDRASISPLVLDWTSPSYSRDDTLLVRLEPLSIPSARPPARSDLDCSLARSTREGSGTTLSELAWPGEGVCRLKGHAIVVGHSMVSRNSYSAESRHGRSWMGVRSSRRMAELTGSLRSLLRLMDRARVLGRIRHRRMETVLPLPSTRQLLCPTATNCSSDLTPWPPRSTGPPCGQPRRSSPASSVVRYSITLRRYSGIAYAFYLDASRWTGHLAPSCIHWPPAVTISPFILDSSTARAERTQLSIRRASPDTLPRLDCATLETGT